MNRVEAIEYLDNEITASIEKLTYLEGKDRAMETKRLEDLLERSIAYEDQLERQKVENLPKEKEKKKDQMVKDALKTGKVVLTQVVVPLSVAVIPAYFAYLTKKTTTEKVLAFEMGDYPSQRIMTNFNEHLMNSK